MAHGMGWAGLLSASGRAGWVWFPDGGGGMSLVMGLDQHRAQISAEWIDTMTAEVFRARIAPADRAGVRKFLQLFR